MWLKDSETANAYYTWGEIIERAAKDSRIAPGDVIGSGTVGGGSIREAIRKGYEAARWLEEGDVVELEVENIGMLRNSLSSKRNADVGYRYGPKNPTATPEPGTARDYRYQRSR